jgi:hypothetical protein
MPLALGLPHLNPPAVFVAGLAHMVTCLVWFSPAVFGNTWARLTGQYARPGARWLAAGFVGHQAVALVLAVIVG